jgi:hypothetical protein
LCVFQHVCVCTYILREVSCKQCPLMTECPPVMEWPSVCYRLTPFKEGLDFVRSVWAYEPPPLAGWRCPLYRYQSSLVSHRVTTHCHPPPLCRPLTYFTIALNLTPHFSQLDNSPALEESMVPLRKCFPEGVYTVHCDQKLQTEY